jgi:hypothetical protein
MGNSLSRNAVVVGIAACSLLGGGCSGSNASSNPGPDPIDQHLGQLHQALLASPDHLRARADEAVATGDPVKIAQFVLAHVSVLPPLKYELPEYSLRFGARGALRAGAGSFRDRAELLSQLLVAAGFTTTIMTANRAGWGAEVYQPIAAPFQPDMTILRSLGAVAGVTIPASFGDDSAALALVSKAVARITSAIPVPSQVALTSVGPLPSTVPIVEYARGSGAKSWAIALGTTNVVSTPPAGLGSATPASSGSVRIGVLVALVPPNGSLTLDDQTLYEVAAGDWKLDEIVGRGVSVAFAPPVTLQDGLGVDLTGYPMRSPVLQLQSLDPLPAETVATHGGSALSLAGGLYRSDSQGTIVGPFGAVPAPLSDPARASAVARAAKLEATANGGAFPSIDLRVSVVDGLGQVIGGLGAGELVVKEEGALVQPAVLSNAPPAQARIVVLYDTSGSVMWPTTQARTDFETTLANALVAADASSPFVMQVVGLGSSAGPNWAAPNASDIETALTGVFSDSSVWAAVGQVVEEAGASGAILVSDCVSGLEDPALVPVFKNRLLAAGIPIAVVPTGIPDMTALNTIVTRSGGRQLDPTSLTLGADLASFVAGAVQTSLSAAYRLSYQAPATGPTTRHVDVSLHGRADLHATAAYAVPAAGTAVTPRGVAGVYLSITTGGVTDLRRLAGVELTSSGRLGRVATPADVVASTNVLNGITDVMVDVPGATSGQQVDDALRALLTFGGWRQAPAGDPKAIATAARAARRLPWLGAALGTPVAAGGVSPAGVVVRVFTTTRSASGLAIRSDLPPTLGTQFGTGSDPAQAFAAALSAGVGASVRESQWMQGSAAAALADQALVVAPGSDGLPGWDAATQAAFRPLLARYDSFIRLVPASGAVVAIWVVDPTTGTATAVAADSSGGGSSGCTIQDSSGLSGMLSSALLYVNLACAGGVASGYQCTGADVAGVATLAYGSFTNPVGAATTPAGTAAIASVLLSFGAVAPGGVAICIQLMLALGGAIQC